MSNNHVIELKAYNPPKAVENRQDDWVKFGDKNDYYQFLIDRYNNSTTNNQVINNIVKLIFGKGLDARDAGRKPNEYAQMKMLFSKETTKRAVTDMYLLLNRLLVLRKLLEHRKYHCLLYTSDAADE